MEGSPFDYERPEGAEHLADQSPDAYPLDDDLFRSGRLRFGRDLLQPSILKEQQLAAQAAEPATAPPEPTDPFQRAHDIVFRMEPEQIVAYISEKLGRLTVARVAGTPDVNSVSRWSSGRTRAEDARMERMRHAAYAYCALEELGFSANAAKFWFRGAHPSLGDEAPMDILSRGEFKRTIAAVRDHALRAASDPRWATKKHPDTLP